MAKIVLIVDMALMRKANFDTAKLEKTPDGKRPKVITTSFETMKPLLNGGAHGILTCEDVPAELQRIPGLIVRQFNDKDSFLDYRNKTLYQPMPTALPDEKSVVMRVMSVLGFSSDNRPPVKTEIKEPTNWKGIAWVTAAASAGAALYYFFG